MTGLVAQAAQFRMREPTARIGAGLRKIAALGAQASVIGRMLRIAFDADDAAAAAFDMLGVDQHAATDAAVAARRARPRASHDRGADAIHQPVRSAWAGKSSSDSHTSPASTRAANFRTQPTSGAQASPVASAMFQLCSGQVTVSPATMPCDSGPPLCGQRSSTAYTWSVAVRNSAMLSASARSSTRAPSAGMSSSLQMRTQVARSIAVSTTAFSTTALMSALDFNRNALVQPQRLVLTRLLAGDARRPRIGQAFQREQQALVQRAAVVRVLDHALADVIHADTVDVVHGAVEVVRLLAIQLQEGAGVFLDFVAGLHLDQELRDLGLDAAVAADVDFPTRIHRDDSDVLDAGFGAVARATGH